MAALSTPIGMRWPFASFLGGTGTDRSLITGPEAMAVSDSLAQAEMQGDQMLFLRIPERLSVVLREQAKKHVHGCLNRRRPRSPPLLAMLSSSTVFSPSIPYGLCGWDP